MIDGTVILALLVLGVQIGNSSLSYKKSEDIWGYNPAFVSSCSWCEI